jgi:ribosomal protein L21E
MKTKDPDTYAHIELHALIECLEEALSWLRDVVDSKRIVEATPTPSQRLADGRLRARTWATQELGKPRPAHTRMATTATPPSTPNVMVPGDRVTITWDRSWQWKTSTTRMPRTAYEGSRGTVVRTTPCFVWVAVDDTNDVIKKRTHNVQLVAV